MALAALLAAVTQTDLRDATLEAPGHGRDIAPATAAAASPSVAGAGPTTSTTSGVPGACALRPCVLHVAGSPLLYVDEYEDGSGHRLTNIIHGMAVAARNGMNFGGAKGVPKYAGRRPHGHEFREVLEGFFGPSAAGQLLPEPTPEFDATFKSVRALEQERAALPDLARVHLPDANEWSHNDSEPYAAYFTAELHAALLAPLLRWPLAFSGARPSVALHLRRGDLRRGQWMVYPDTYYLDIVALIRERWPAADVHAWSSTKVRKQDERGKYWTDSDFDALRAAGIVVHLDDDSLVEVMAHFARADAFVMAPSYLSYAAAIPSRSCVVYPGGDVNNHGRALAGWVDGKQPERPGYAEELRACVARGLRSRNY